MKKSIWICGLVLMLVNGLAAQTVFTLAAPDKKASPYTGMTRKHWQDAALYLIQGAFSHIHNLDDPMLFPKQEGKSYPRNAQGEPTAMLEGLCRTMFIAGPLLKENPDLEVNGLKVGDYYRHQMMLLLDSTSKTYVKDLAPNGGPSQTLVEFGGLALSLMLAPDVFWEPLPAPAKQALATKMLSYGEGPSIAMNWRFFNINIMSFFKSRGYSVKDAYLQELLEKTLQLYRGDGWYNDAPYYDYYSMWAFQMYGSFWAEYFGKKYYPEIAGQFISHLHDAAAHYPKAFSRNGQMIMWGRSISYRMGAAMPLPLMGYTGDSSLNYGWMRRISSATILQFVQHPDFLKDNVPTLGFYGAFEPAVQTYSCRGSAYWLGKLFLALYTAADNPFWTATENEGLWQKDFKQGKVYSELQQKTDILLTNYPNIGASEIRATTHSKDIGVYQGTENYNRLSYSSIFPWQADGPNGEVAMNYLFKREGDKNWEAGRMFRFQGYQNGFYLRTLQMAADTSIQLSLAEKPLPNGILRVDKVQSGKAVSLRLGHYALPQKSTPIAVQTTKIGGYEAIILDNGAYQLAMVKVKGWDDMEALPCTNLHPEAVNSYIINARKNYSSGKDNHLVTLMLWKPSGKKFTRKDLPPAGSLSMP